MATFRKSKKIGGIRLTLSPKGVSASTGVKGARVSANSKGQVHRTIGVPGTGIYDRKRVGSAKKGEPNEEPVAEVSEPEKPKARKIKPPPKQPPADWYPDPDGVHRLRYWDGSAWTEHFAD